MRMYIKYLMAVSGVFLGFGLLTVFIVCCSNDDPITGIVVFIFGFPLLPVLCNKLDSMDGEER